MNKKFFKDVVIITLYYLFVFVSLFLVAFFAKSYYWFYLILISILTLVLIFIKEFKQPKKK